MLYCVYIGAAIIPRQVTFAYYYSPPRQNSFCINRLLIPRIFVLFRILCVVFLPLRFEPWTGRQQIITDKRLIRPWLLFSFKKHKKKCPVYRRTHGQRILVLCLTVQFSTLSDSQSMRRRHLYFENLYLHTISCLLLLQKM